MMFRSRLESDERRPPICVGLSNEKNELLPLGRLERYEGYEDRSIEVLGEEADVRREERAVEVEGDCTEGALARACRRVW